MAGSSFIRATAGALAFTLATIGSQAATAQRPPATTADPFAPGDAPRRSDRQPPRGGTQESAAPASAAERQQSSSAEERIETELGRTTNIEVVEMPLKDCALFLSDQHGIPIVLNSKKLDEANISPDAVITKSLREITLRSALNLLLEDLECAFLVKDEVLQITTQADARTILQTRVYDCRDLVGAEEAQRRNEPATAVGGGAMPGAPGGLAGRGAGNERESRVQRLLALLMANIDPDTWQTAAAGGLGEPSAQHNQPRGMASEYDGLIVVTQTARTHDKVERLLNMLREAAGVEGRPSRVVR